MELFTLDYQATPSFAPILFLINLSQQLIWELWETSNMLHVNRPLQPTIARIFLLFWCNPFCGKSSKLTVLIICLPAPDEVCAVITKWDILSTASSRQAGFFYNRLYISVFYI